jgi:hypothetical protein
MTKEEACSRIREVPVIPAIRVSSGDDAHFAAEAVTRGGIPIVEITMTVPGALELMAHLVRSDPKVIVGAGTVLDTDTVRLCIDAGVGFVTAPSMNPTIMEFAARSQAECRSHTRSIDTNRSSHSLECWRQMGFVETSDGRYWRLVGDARVMPPWHVLTENYRRHSGRTIGRATAPDRDR